MQACHSSITIVEYGRLSRNVHGSDCTALPVKSFDALEKFVLENKSIESADAAELLSLSSRCGVGKIITARNYVGVIETNDGTVIEILPKIYPSTDYEQTRRLFITMLRTLKEAPFKTFSMTGLKTDRLNLFEIFVKMFLDETALVVRQGLKSAYELREDNQRFYKGKLLTAKHLKHNIFRKDLFFVGTDEFTLNRPENRLIESALLFLHTRARDARNQRDAGRLLGHFDGIEESADYGADFAVCSGGRGMTHYGTALAWCRVLLTGNSFSSFAGDEQAFALLFPMERVFESFIAAKIRAYAADVDCTVRIQDQEHSLFEKPKRTFELRPDIVLQKDDKTVILDTKWKLLSSGASGNPGIAQSDMYQAYAYAKKYNADKVILLYPLSEKDIMKKNDLRYISNDNAIVEIKFIDLLNPNDSLMKLLAHCFRVQNCP